MEWQLAKSCLRGAPEIQSYTTHAELRALSEAAARCRHGAVALEIGSHLGASTCYIAAGLSRVGGRLFCVDTWHNETMPEGLRDTFAEFSRNTAGAKVMITPLRKPSGALVRDDLILPLDFAFIDADHSYYAVKQDWHLIAPWMSQDGVLAFHDCIAFEGVSRVVGEALASGQWRLESHTGNLLFIRRARFRK